METINLIKRDGYHIIELSRGKVNAINQQMVNELRCTLKELVENDECGGVILTGKPHVFSAGLDVIELYGYDKPRIRTFFSAFGALHVELVKFKKPLIAAVSGHSPAGGCVMVIACDHRIMAEGDEYSIGLNEVAVNVQISQNLVDAYGFWLGTGLAHQFILAGKLLNPVEALDCGLVNEICPLDNVLPQAELKMKKYLQANQKIFINSKAKLRRHWLDGLTLNADEDLKESMDMWWDPAVRERMKAFVMHLQNK